MFYMMSNNGKMKLYDRFFILVENEMYSRCENNRLSLKMQHPRGGN